MPLAHGLDAFGRFAWFNSNHDKPFGLGRRLVTRERKIVRLETRCNHSAGLGVSDRKGAVEIDEAKLRALMIASLGGHARAYQALLRLSAERLRLYFRRRLPGRDADVEDLVQDTLIAIHRKRASYDTGLPFTAWLHGIARYRLIDFLRREYRQVSVPIDDEFDAADSSTVDAILAEVDVANLLAKLSPKQADAIRLTRIEGLSVRDAAMASGQSEPSIKVNVHRGIGRLVAAMKGKG
jgi:RNA polymerase sigma factor (sigma-70 family)